MYALGFYAEQIKRLKEIKSKDLPRSEKEDGIKEIMQVHVEFIKQRITFYERLLVISEEAIPTFVEKVLEDC